MKIKLTGNEDGTWSLHFRGPKNVILRGAPIRKGVPTADLKTEIAAIVGEARQAYPREQLPLHLGK